VFGDHGHEDILWDAKCGCNDKEIIVLGKIFPCFLLLLLFFENR
jgi:hypothetical protein